MTLEWKVTVMTPTEMIYLDVFSQEKEGIYLLVHSHMRKEGVIDYSILKILPAQEAYIINSRRVPR